MKPYKIGILRPQDLPTMAPQIGVLSAVQGFKIVQNGLMVSLIKQPALE